MTVAPSRPDAEARRTKIREAASRCARLSGFHGASMAEIAHEAGLSVGQIYRYFENKEAIIAAIVSQDVADMRAKFAELESGGRPQVDELVERMIGSLAEHCDPARTALRLEVIAEAARNPCVARIVQESAAEERSLKQAFLQRMSASEGVDRRLVARGEVISMLFEGMLMRSVCNPEADLEAIIEILRPILRRLVDDEYGDEEPAAHEDNVGV